MDKTTRKARTTPRASRSALRSWGLYLLALTAWVTAVVALALLSLPCVLGFNVWAGVEVPGIGNIQAIEDFLMSNNVLPLGALVFLLFCTTRRGWGWDAFVREADTGEGARFPRWARGYVRFALPALILAVFVAGYVPIVQVWLGMG